MKVPKADDCSILSKDEKVLGYELLFRESPQEDGFNADFEGGTRRMIDTLNVMGLDAVCDGAAPSSIARTICCWKDSFCCCLRTRRWSKSRRRCPSMNAWSQPASNSDWKATKSLSTTLRRAMLQEKLIPFANYLKIDITGVVPPHSAALVGKYGASCIMIAQKVETRLQFISALKDGFTLFQGYFFRQPERMRARHIPTNQASQLRLLKAISAPEVDVAVVKELIKQDASLCYRLLRYLNSPLVGVSNTVKSVRHGITLLGERELVRWIRMATTLIMGQEKCSDLVLASLVRARFCELIAPKVNHGSCDLFLIGMFSLMDAILEVPMGVVIEGLAFDDETRTQLLGMKTGKPTALSPIYDLMVSREAGEWDVVTRHAKKLNLSLPFVNRGFNDAVSGAHQMTSAAPNDKP